MPQIELIVILGQYAIDYHLPRESSEAVNPTSPITKPQTTSSKISTNDKVKAIPKLKPITVTQACAQWQQYWPKYLVLPHPSPRNNLWLKQHPEFERDMLPRLRMRIASLLNLQPH